VLEAGFDHIASDLVACSNPVFIALRKWMPQKIRERPSSRAASLKWA
jgi:hypothetical protein